MLKETQANGRNVQKDGKEGIKVT